MTTEQKESPICVLCGCPFGPMHEAGKAFCDDCDQGPFCRMCLIMRHKPKHGHGWWAKLMRGMGWHSCAMCVTVPRTRVR